MDEKESANYLTITDEDGKSYELEHLDTIELDGRYFMAFLPADLEPEDEHYGMLILEAFPGDDGEDYLELPDDEEQERVYNIFMERLFSDEDEPADEADKEK